MMVTGSTKFQNKLVRPVVEGSSAVSSRPIIGTAPSRNTLPVFIARSSATRMGPNSGTMPSAMRRTISTAR